MLTAMTATIRIAMTQMMISGVSIVLLSVLRSIFDAGQAASVSAGSLANQLTNSRW
jgi:hypothetical protein